MLLIFIVVDMLHTNVRKVKPMAEGSYGCIYTEENAPPCKTDKTDKPKGERKVRKLLKKDDAKIELATSKLIQSIPLWEYYFVVQEGW